MEKKNTKKVRSQWVEGKNDRDGLGSSPQEWRGWVDYGKLEID